MTVICAIVADDPPINCLSISRVCAVYPDPPSVIVTAVTVPLPFVVTLALAPCHVVVPALNNFILWNVPLAVYPDPPLDIVE